jgi:ABC-type transport system substrate-binding protein
LIEKYINIFNIHPVLKNKLVRQALSHLIPRQKICNLYNKDKDNWSHETSTEAEPCALPVFPNFWAFDESLKPYSYSHRLAKQLLSEAGYSSTTPSPSPSTTPSPSPSTTPSPSSSTAIT